MTATLNGFQAEIDFRRAVSDATAVGAAQLPALVGSLRDVQIAERIRHSRLHEFTRDAHQLARNFAERGRGDGWADLTLADPTRLLAFLDFVTEVAQTIDEDYTEERRREIRAFFTCTDAAAWVASVRR